MNTNSNIEKHRVALQQIKAERDTVKKELQPLRERHREWGEVIARTDATLFSGKNLYEADEKAAREERSTAFKKRAELDVEIQRLERKDGELSSRMSELSREIAKAEYIALSPSELKELADCIASDIRTTEQQLSDLDQERQGLLEKRQHVEAANEEIKDADQELRNAQKALKQQQGEAFLEGRSADLAPYKARVAKAEKRVTVAKEQAEAGNAALPQIAEKLDAIEVESQRLRASLVAKRSEWFANRTRQQVAIYRESALALFDSIKIILATDRFTGNSLGAKLLEPLRRGVPMPISEKYVEPLETRHLFGPLVVPDVASAVQLLEAEFQQAISG